MAPSKYADRAIKHLMKLKIGSNIYKRNSFQQTCSKAIFVEDIFYFFEIKWIFAIQQSQRVYEQKKQVTKSRNWFISIFTYAV